MNLHLVPSAPDRTRLFRGACRRGRGRRVPSALLLLAVLGAVVVSPRPASTQPIPTLTIENNVGEEGDSGIAVLEFVVTLSDPAEHPVSADFSTTDGTATAGATGEPGDEDYIAKSGTVSFDPGGTEETIGVEIVGDGISEHDESVFVSLSNIQGANSAGGIAEGLIQNDDFSVLSIQDAAGDEGGNMEFAVSLSSPSSLPVTVDFQTFDDTATAGGAQPDYVPALGTLLFQPGDTMESLGVQTVDNDEIEPDESFVVPLFNVQGQGLAGLSAFPDDRGFGLIVNDDGVATPALRSWGRATLLLGLAGLGLAAIASHRAVRSG